MPEYDWDKIRREYIADPTASLRKLCAKYGVGLTSIRDRCSKEKWVEKRERARAKADTKVEELCVVAAVSEAEAIIEARNRLAERALVMITKQGLSPRDVKDLATALSTLARMAGMQPELDEKEQKARIASIVAKTEAPEEEEGAGVILLPDKEWDDE